jgi:hypothetical protein
MVKLYVEGGGDSDALKRECREAFSKFFCNAGVNKKPRVVACGGRQNAYASFCTAIRNGESALLLVDSEAPIDESHQLGESDAWTPWGHLRNRDGWEKPNACTNAECHLMVECMEAWLLADVACLADFYGNGFKESKLPAANSSVETVSKSDLFSALKEATKDCIPKGQYGKGKHSFKLLATIDTNQLLSRSPWARRFITVLKQKMDV